MGKNMQPVTGIEIKFKGYVQNPARENYCWFYERQYISWKILRSRICELNLFVNSLSALENNKSFCNVVKQCKKTYKLKHDSVTKSK